MRVLLVAGSPEPSSPALVARLAAGADSVMAVDRGAEACRAAGVVPDSFCGDADTVAPETLERLCARAGSSPEDVRRLGAVPADDVREVPEVVGLAGSGPVRLFPPAKYDTDLSLAFSCARQLARERAERLEVTVTCASGGRMDHALAVFGVLAANADLAPVLVEDDSECRVLSPAGAPEWRLGPEARGHALSFVALADGTLVSERGMRWELDRFRVDALRDRGISNVVEAPDALVACHAGVLAAFLMRARLEP